MRLDKADAGPALVVSLEIALMLLFGFVGLGAVSNLFADYKDSRDSTYITIGGLFFALAAIPGVVALLSLRTKGFAFRAASGTLGIAVFAASFILLTSWHPNRHRALPEPPPPPATNGSPPTMATPSLLQPVPIR
jgi:hypothetical protein